jgi:hypothetical protein
MPRSSDHTEVILALSATIESLQEITNSMIHMSSTIAAVQNVEDTDNSDDSDYNSFVDVIETTEHIIQCLQLTQQEICLKRYLSSRKPYCTGMSNRIFNRDLKQHDNNDGSPPWLLEDEFLQKYRMHCDSFTQLLHMIEGHPIFKSDIKKNRHLYHINYYCSCIILGRVAAAPATHIYVMSFKLAEEQLLCSNAGA